MRIQATILIASVAAVLTLRAPAAHACNRGGGYGGSYAGVIIIGLGALAVDTGFTVWNLGTLGQDHSAGYGVAELLIAGPQFGLAVTNLQHGFPAWYATWMGALTVHALWTIGSAMASAPPPRDAQSHAFKVGPTFVPDGQRSVPGLGFTGRF